MSPAQAAIAWLELADEQESHALSGVAHPDAAKFNAALFRRTARSIEIGAETGVAVCACCLKPFGEGHSIGVRRA